jgi:hypothetical protein
MQTVRAYQANCPPGANRRESSKPRVLTLLSLTTKVALTVTAPGMLEALTSVATKFTPLVMALGNVFW